MCKMSLKKLGTNLLLLYREIKYKLLIYKNKYLITFIVWYMNTTYLRLFLFIISQLSDL